MSDKAADGKKPRRRLKAPAETVRQKQASVQSQADRPAGVRRGKLKSAITWPFRKIGGLSLWQGTWFKPFRFVGRWVGLILVPPYFRNSWRELRLVTWPNWRLSWRLTFAVLAFALVLALAIAGVDWLLDRLFKDILLK